MSLRQFIQDWDQISEDIAKGDIVIEGEQAALTPEMVKRVYHRDYWKTRNKSYRKYSAQKRAKKSSRRRTAS